MNDLFADFPTVVWTPMVIPALDILEPNLKPGAVILCDNVTASKEGYADFFARIRGLETKYKTVTLPYEGGLEMVTYCP
jgi:predicted O-methyltransferase YrrM